MYFDGTCCKDGSKVCILLISLNGINYKFSFTLIFPYTSNIEEYEALILGLRLAHKHGIKCLYVIDESEKCMSLRIRD